MDILVLFLIPWGNTKIALEDVMPKVKRSEERTRCKKPYVCLLIFLLKEKKCSRGEIKEKKREEKGNKRIIQKYL